MHEVIVDYEYRPVVAGINGLIDIKWTGGGIIVKTSSGRENDFGAGERWHEKQCEEKSLNWKEGR